MREQPKEILSEIFSFLLGVTDITGTVIDRRIAEVLGLGHEATTLYKTKTTDKKFN